MVGHIDVVNPAVAVEVEVVDAGILAVKSHFKAFQGFRLLEQLHGSVEIQVITRETQVILLPILSPDGCRGCDQEGKNCGGE